MSYQSDIWALAKTVETLLAAEATVTAFGIEQVTTSTQLRHNLKQVPEADHRITIVPRGEAHEMASRKYDNSIFELQILVQRKVATTTTADALADAFFALVETIKKYLRDPDRRADGISYQRSTHEPLYGDDHLQDFNQLTSVLTISLRKITS